MIQNIQSFLTYVRHRLFTWRIEREIYNEIAPQVRGEQDNGYEFEGLDGLVRAADRMGREVRRELDFIDREAVRMGKADGNAFRLIMHRNIARSLKMYRAHMHRRQLPETCDPRLVATRA